MADDKAPASAKPAVEAPADAMRRRLVQIGPVLGVALAVANVAFFFLSMLYVKHRPDTDLTRVRLDFLAFTVAVDGMALVGTLWPSWTGHGLAALLGLVELGAGVSALNSGLPPVLGVTLVVLGALCIVLAYRSYDGSRAAWSFLIAISAVLAVTFLFGAPKVRAQLGIGLWIALIFPGLSIVATTTLSALRADYRRR